MALSLEVEAVDALEARGEDLVPPVAIEVRHLDAVQHGERLVDLPDLPRLLGLRGGRNAQRWAGFGACALGAGTEDRGVDEHRPPVAFQIAPPQAMDHRVHGDRRPLPKVVGLRGLPEDLDLTATGRLVKVESAGQGDHGPAVVVEIPHGQVDVLGGSGNRMPLPARILVPVHAIGLGRKGDHVWPAVAVDVGDGDLVTRGEVVDQVTLEL